MAQAQKGINASIVGVQPDTQSPYGGGGSRGINQINDEPYRANQIIPGNGDRTNSTGLGELVDMNSMSDFENQDVEQADESNYDDNQDVAGMSEPEWVDLGRRCYDIGRNFYRQGHQTQHLNNSYMFKGRHGPGSKYNTEAFKNRSKIFRPLTRMASRSWEADIATALFLNDDYMHISSRRVSDENSAASASVLKEIMNLRLDKNWYTTCIGAAQDTFINGPVIGKVFWWHESVTTVSDQPVTDASGNLIGIETVSNKKVIKDEPTIELILPENFIYDPTAKWNDVIGTGNYFIHRKQMSADEVMVKMNNGEWQKLDKGQILTCRWAMEDDAVQQGKRGENKPDPINNDNADTRYELVLVNEVFVRREGVWYTYHMMGTQFLLEAPDLLENRYHHGRLPFVYGTAMIESHNNAPDSKTQLGSQLQEAVNEVSNQRMDNVKLALNKRYLAKRGAAIDLASLTRSSPGGVTMTTDPTNDVMPLEVNDVTQSSYEETQRLTMEMNEAQGTFSGQAVANNREMNETVGGMKLLSNAATKVNDFDIRTFVMTWVRPVLELYMLTIQYYENDQTIMQIAVENSEFFPRLKPEDLTDDFMTKQLELKVDTGIGATDPVQRVNTMMYGVSTVLSLPGMMDQMDSKAVGSAIFSTLGQGDGSKFFPSLARNYQEPQDKAPPPPDPLVLAAQEEAKGRIQEANVKAESELQQLQMKLESEQRIKLIQMALDAEMQGKQGQLDILMRLLDNETKLRIAGAQDVTKRQTTVLQHGSQMAQAQDQRQHEVNQTQAANQFSVQQGDRQRQHEVTQADRANQMAQALEEAKMIGAQKGPVQNEVANGTAA